MGNCVQWHNNDGKSFLYGVIIMILLQRIVFPRSLLISKVLIYPLVSLIADIGGTLGLFLGFSFMTIWDGVEVFGLTWNYLWTLISYFIISWMLLRCLWSGWKVLFIAHEDGLRKALQSHKYIWWSLILEFSNLSLGAVSEDFAVALPVELCVLPLHHRWRP